MLNTLNRPTPSDNADRDTIEPAFLSPAQLRAFNELVEVSAACPLVALEGAPGAGKTSILRAFADAFAGEVVSWDDFIDKAASREVEATDVSVVMAIESALENAAIVLVDNAEALVRYYGRRGDHRYLSLEAIVNRAANLGRRIIVAAGDIGALFPRALNRFLLVRIDAFEPADYQSFLVNSLGAEQVADIDFELLHQHASMLSGHDLRALAGLLLEVDSPSTEDAIERLDAVILESNTRLTEVEELSFSDLPGTEAIAAQLETHILLPFEDRKLARKLGLKPKRGVLLYGPPGTGKTSIGRALAHRMKGRLHLIDGSFITEPPVHFFSKLRTIVKEAKDNAPSVLFVDDADVLFGIEHISGLSRFLLSLLDGVESEGAGQVCVMMTAMNVSKIPSAIMRSGRIELWLETRLPDAETRAAILRKWLGEGLPDHAQIDYAAVAERAQRFTPADLRRITGDARTYFAADSILGREPESGQSYLIRAVDELTATRSRMADNLRDESLRIGTIAPKAKYGQGIGGLAEANISCRVVGW